MSSRLRLFGSRLTICQVHRNRRAPSERPTMFCRPLGLPRTPLAGQVWYREGLQLLSVGHSQFRSTHTLTSNQRALAFTRRSNHPIAPALPHTHDLSFTLETGTSSPSLKAVSSYASHQGLYGRLTHMHRAIARQGCKDDRSECVSGACPTAPKLVCNPIAAVASGVEVWL